MKTIDMTLQDETYDFLKTLIGQTIQYLVFDPLQFLEVPYMNAFLDYGDGYLKVTNQSQLTDYFGEESNMAVFSVEDAMEMDDNFHANIYPVNRQITKIDVVNEIQQTKNAKGDILYDVRLVRGLIVHFNDGLELSFEKQCIPYSEEINIEEGQFLIDIFDIPEYFFTHFDDVMPSARREVITIK
ncbi:MAG: hypothetical protein J6P61_07310 [Erysipelotrichaceae bacterium]|nr:hypothetical protein [Erysipelotrichaceae bacterium]